MLVDLDIAELESVLLNFFTPLLSNACVLQKLINFTNIYGFYSCKRKNMPYKV